MPRYNYGYVNPMEQYQDSPFDPLTGRLNGGQLVMQVINEIAARKKQKQQEGFEVEDREWQKVLRDLQKKQAEMGIAQAEREAKDYVSPGAKEQARLLTEGIAAARDQKNRVELEKVRGEQDRLTADARGRANAIAKKGQTDAIKKQYLAAKKAIEAAYSKELADIETKYTSQVAGVRASASKPNSTMLSAGPMPNNYLIGLTGARSAYKRMKDEAAKRLSDEIARLNESYKEALSMTEMPQEEQAQQEQPEVYVNPETGERIVWNGSAWVPIK